MGKKVITWNDEADAKLLLGIIEISKPKLDYEALAKWMGEGVTISAVAHRIRRIKDKAKANGLPIDDDNNNNNNNNTGTDTAKSPTGTPVKGGKRGRKPAAAKTEGPAAKKVKGGGGAVAVAKDTSSDLVPFEGGGDGEDANEA